MVACKRSVVVAALICLSVAGRALAQDAEGKAPAERPTVKVLIIGNSQISANDLPRLIETVSRPAPEDVPRIEVTGAIVQGATLKKCWDAEKEGGPPRSMILAQKWDWVVVQEIFCPDKDQFEEYATKFNKEIKKVGSKTLLFATASTSEFHYASFKYPGSFQRLNDMQIAYGREHGIPVAAAGYAWMKYLGANPSVEKRLELYAKDKAHPGLKGSAIYAYLLYAHFTGRNPEDLPLPDEDLTYEGGVIPTPDGDWAWEGGTISREELAAMRKAAWAQYQEDMARMSDE